MTLFKRNLATLPVGADPFPHAVLDGLFAPEVFQVLADSFPVCPPASGPTGRTVHRGDPHFDAVMQAEPLWRTLFDEVNSQSFVDTLAALFAAEMERACFVDRTALRFIDHVETRQEKEQGRIHRPASPPEDVFVRFDFMQGMDAYAREAHLDHRRRLATLLIYFDTPGPETYAGGGLLLHDTRGGIGKRLSPAANRGVLFPCSEKSWHSVDAVTNCLRPRRFVQIAASSAHDLWPTAHLPTRSPLKWARRLLACVPTPSRTR